MIEQIEKFDNNVLSIEVIDGFTKTDEKFCQTLFNEKIEQGFEQINVLLKLDGLKLSNSSINALFKDSLWSLRNYKKLEHLAIVAHSKVLKTLVPLDNVFFSRGSKRRQERYFDVSQLEQAKTFVNPNKNKS